LFLKIVAEDEEKLIHIMLLIHFPLTPPEGVEQLEGSDCLFPRLEIVEYALYAKGYRLEIVCVSWHHVNGASKVSNEKEMLEKRVEVAGRPLIYQSIVFMLKCFSSPSSLRPGSY
jgi:hypothetical protein